MASTTLGRATAGQLETGVMKDEPSQEMAAVMTTLDLMIDAIQDIAVAEGWADANGLIAALSKIKLRI